MAAAQKGSLTCPAGTETRVLSHPPSSAMKDAKKLKEAAQLTIKFIYELSYCAVRNTMLPAVKGNTPRQYIWGKKKRSLE